MAGQTRLCKIKNKKIFSAHKKFDLKRSNFLHFRVSYERVFFKATPVPVIKSGAFVQGKAPKTAGKKTKTSGGKAQPDEGGRNGTSKEGKP